MALTIVQRHDRLLRRSRRLFRLERRLAAWMQLWAIVVVVLFGVKWFVAELPWWVVAAVAGGQTILFGAINLTNVYRYRTETRRAEVEAEYEASQIQHVE